MEIVLLIARLLLAVVFVVAGLAKAADLPGTRKALVGFGVPESLATPLGWLLPVVEILVALALLPLQTAWLGGVGAAALLLVFLVGIGVNLARGNAPDCHCFGQLHSEPVGWSVFTRNLLLAALAGLIVVAGKERPGLSAFDWLGDLKAGEVAGLVLSIAAVGLLLPTVVYLRRVLRQQTTMLEELAALKKVIDEDYAEPAPLEREEAVPPVEGLPVGAPAPSFSLTAIGGEQVTLDDLLAAGKSVLLLFVSPTCSPCKTLLPLLRVWERDYTDQLTIALLSKGTLEENQKRVAKYGASHLLLQGESDVAEEYQAKWTPAAVLVSPGGRISSQVSYGDEAIRALVTHTVATAEVTTVGSNGHRPHITVGSSLFKVGESAPRFSLPDLNGKVVDAEDLLGRDTLLLFWNPGCPHCRAMTEDLNRYEENARPGAPRLVIITSGEAAATEALSQEFSSLALSDPEFDIGPLFGTNSTPSAVLIDSEGRIASSLATGEKNILALAGVRKVSLPIAARN